MSYLCLIFLNKKHYPIFVIVSKNAQPYICYIYIKKTPIFVIHNPYICYIFP